MTTIWVDASFGASGDMLLGALLGSGVPTEVIQDAVSAVSPEPVEISSHQVTRGALDATRCVVDVADSETHRTWRHIRELLTSADLDDRVRDLATSAFERLAVAEGAVHGTSPDDVHFHEVGALDAIADVVGVCAGFAWLGATEVVVSPVAVGSGTIDAAHGTLPVPPPAVAELLRGVPSYAGPAGAPATELCTPTGAALLTALASSFGSQPAMTTSAIGIGAGGRDPEGYTNIVRVLVGGTSVQVETELVIEANVDDLDPRVWPTVLDALLAAGAVDAWLSSITMKKGRPAHTVHALTPTSTADAVRRAIVDHTSTIGTREYPVTKRALPREFAEVEVDGQTVRVKVTRSEGAVVTAQPEWDDVARAAAALGRPARHVLAAAIAASQRLRSG